MNEKVTLEMVDVLLKSHPDVVEDVDPLGKYPLHLACSNPMHHLDCSNCLVATTRRTDAQ